MIMQFIECTNYKSYLNLNYWLNVMFKDGLFMVYPDTWFYVLFRVQWIRANHAGLVVLCSNFYNR